MKAAKAIKILPYMLVLAAIIFLFKPLLFGKLPMPWDGLVGTYFPWLDYKWGYEVGVPVKNAALSDAFSLYQWRTIALEAIRHFQLPLWNPYSFSGIPLLANWQSAPFYPLNLLMLIFGDLWGWSLMIVFQPLGALFFTYLYLKQLGLKPVSSLLGGMIFALAGFMTTYLEYNTGAQILLWLPALLFLTEKYFASEKAGYLFLISLVIFCVATGGFFQPALYVYLVFGSYYLIRNRTLQKNRQVKILLSGAFFSALGLGLAAIQLIPVLELLRLSIRNLDANIIEYQFGLLPLKHALTFLAPDFFGNPVTYNFWGVMQYQETAGYFSAVGLVLVICGFFSTGNKEVRNFFAFIFLLSVVLAFKNPLSMLIYSHKLPLLATGYASRWLMLTGFGAAVLAALAIDADDRKRLFAWGLVIGFCLFVLAAYSGGLRFIFERSDARLSFDAPVIADNLKVAFRNSLLPLATVLVFTSICFILKKSKLLPVLILALISFDLIRFSIKFNPFTSAEMASNNLDVMRYVQNNIGYYRIEKEEGPVLPLNSWMNFRLMSPAGYDPLSTLEYGSWFRVYNSDGTATKFEPEKLVAGGFTRYLQWSNYQSPFIDLAGVKYILALKRDKDSVVSSTGTQFFYSFPTDRFKQIYDYGTVAVFENPAVMDRVTLFDQYEVESDFLSALERLRTGFNFRQKLILDIDPQSAGLARDPTDTATITRYSAGQIDILTQTQAPTLLLLTDVYYPGWKAYINDQQTPIYRADGIYRAVTVPAGNNRISFSYSPQSFSTGVKIAGSSLIILLSTGFILFLRKGVKRKHRR